MGLKTLLYMKLDTNVDFDLLQILKMSSLMQFFIYTWGNYELKITGWLWGRFKTSDLDCETKAAKVEVGDNYVVTLERN
jgi:hypothetical protein